MADTLSIRLTERDRETLEAEAQRSGTGLSRLVRSLAEAEAKRLRRAEIRAQGERVVEYLKTNPEARAVFTLSDQQRPGEEMRKDDDGERHYLLVGRDLSPEAMADTVMAWLEEQGLAETDEPPSGL